MSYNNDTPIYKEKRDGFIPHPIEQGWIKHFGNGMTCKVWIHGSGTCHGEAYFYSDMIHREDGPAWNNYDDLEGYKYREEYYIFGQRHRVDGPAYIMYDSNGHIVEKAYYLYDEKINVNNDEEFEKYKLIVELAGVK